MQSVQEPFSAIMQVHQQHMVSIAESLGSVPIVGDFIQQTMIFMMQNVMHPMMVTLTGSLGLEPPPCPFMNM
jgi:hypothetical protein